MPCDQCPKRPACKAPCELLEAVLPDPNRGYEHIFPTRSQAQLLKIVRRKATADTLRAHAHLLTAAQRRIFDLYYIEGLSQADIALHLNLRLNSVEESLRSSRLRIGRWLKRDQTVAEQPEPDEFEILETSANASAESSAEAPLRPCPSDADTPILAIASESVTLPPPRLVNTTNPDPDSLQSLPAPADDPSGEESAMSA